MTTMRTLGRNVPYLRQQLGALLGNTSAPVKFICVVVLLGYGLSFSERAVQVLSVTPGYLLPPAFWLWTAFTFCFLELHWWEVAVDIVTVGLCGKLIEPLWGRIEMLQFFMVVNVSVAVLSAAFYLVLYAATNDTDLLFDVHVHGLAGYVAGVAVAVKQIMPDLVLVRTPLGKLTNAHIPVLVFAASAGLRAAGLLDGTHPVMFGSGALVSWTYLRFCQRHSNGQRGHLADNFTFASFFPTWARPAVSRACDAVHGALVKAGLCRRVVRRCDLANPTGVTVVPAPPDPHDVERRRQIALRALSERLAKQAALEVKQQPQQQNKAPTAAVVPQEVVAIPATTGT